LDIIPRQETFEDRKGMAVLTALSALGKAMHLGPLPTQPFSRIKMQIVDKIKDTFLYIHCIGTFNKISV
jgi:hypothetical protein